MSSPGPWKNKLYFGDNLDFLRDREKFPEGFVDLVYLDPPFNSNASYNVLFRERSGERSSAQITAFEDTWEWGAKAQAAYLEVTEKGGKLAELLMALWTFLPNSDMLAYLVMMAPRLIELHRVLKDTGSIYLHCDPNASHYLKLMMDAVFDHETSRTRSFGSGLRHIPQPTAGGDIRDTILFYTKTAEHTWNELLLPHTKEYTERYKYEGEDGRRWTDDNLTGPGLRRGDSGAAWRGFDPSKKGVHWKVNLKTVVSITGEVEATKLSTTQKLDVLDEHGYIYWPKTRSGHGDGWPRFKRYLSDGMVVQDLVTDIPPINSQAQERLGYPTQKPAALWSGSSRSAPQKGISYLTPSVAAAQRSQPQRAFGAAGLGSTSLTSQFRSLNRV